MLKDLITQSPNPSKDDKVALLPVVLQDVILINYNIYFIKIK